MLRFDLMRRIFHADAVNVEIRTLVWRGDLETVGKVSHSST
jgi:hypothetical protein